MHTKLLFVAMAAAILSGCGTLGATGDGGPDATASYIGSAAGKVVKSGSGGCLHSSGFSDESAIASCEGEKPAEKVAAAPPPPPPAPSPAPAVEDWPSKTTGGPRGSTQPRWPPRSHWPP